MKKHNYNKVGIIAVLVSSLMAGIYLFNDYLSKEKRWFYATSTDIKAFDKLYWGMSKEEVERALGSQLQKKNDLDFPGVIVNETTSGFKFKITKPQIIFGVYIKDFDVWFFENKLYKIDLTTSYISNTKLLKDELRLGLVNELNKKYNLINRNSTEFNNLKLNPDMFVVEGLLNNNIGIFMQFYSNKFSNNAYSVNFSLELENNGTINEIKEKIKSQKTDLF